LGKKFYNYLLIGTTFFFTNSQKLSFNFAIFVTTKKVGKKFSPFFLVALLEPGIRDLGSGIWDLRSKICDPGTEI
jgi:hypothetical protein